MLHRAERERDGVARSVLQSDGPIAQQAWGCPIATGREPDRETLDPVRIEALEAVETLTGARCSTCPYYYTRLPWVREAVDARRWRDKGQLQLRVGHPSVALVAAIDAVDRGDNARQLDDLERAKREREEREQRRDRDDHNGG